MRGTITINRQVHRVWSARDVAVVYQHFLAVGSRAEVGRPTQTKSAPIEPLAIEAYTTCAQGAHSLGLMNPKGCDRL